MKNKRPNKNDNPIYYTCHALLDCHLWLMGEDELDELYRLHHIETRLKRAKKKLDEAEEPYFTDSLKELIREIAFWRRNEYANLEAINAALASALKFYMNP